MKIPLVVASIVVATSVLAETNAPLELYPTGLKQAVSIGEDLYSTLDANLARNLNPETVVTLTAATPFIKPLDGGRGGARRVAVSTGFVALLDHIARAKAVDREKPGYWKAYVEALQQPEAADNPPAPPDLADARFHTDEMTSYQAGLFNQMIGMTLALNYAQEYLAHCDKYKAEMAAGLPLPLNDYLRDKDWDESVLYATVNSLDCALGTEGSRALFEAIREMRSRPAWADYIVPPAVNIRRLERQLAHYEYQYFHGDKALRRRLTLVSADATTSRAPTLVVSGTR